ncbi:MAG: hypothetical protein RR324_04515 [Cellulosilyticaceae bacterium]
MSSYSNNPLDDKVNSEFMRVCKCMIPYLDRDVQKNIAVGLKFLELVNTINAYNDENVVNELSLTRQNNWEEDLLHNVRANLSPEKAYIIDAVMKLKEVRSIISTKTTESSDLPTSFYNDNSVEPEHVSPQTNNTASISPASILQAVSPLLDDNQKQLLNLFTTFFNAK